MAVPLRTYQAGTFFVTAVCAGRRRIFQVESAAQLMWDHLQENRGRAYLLHAFVIMPEHLHLLITPTQSLEYALQMVKGGYSRKLRQMTNRPGDVWQRGFADHRIRDREDFLVRKAYLEGNPVARVCVPSRMSIGGPRHTSRVRRLKPLLRVRVYGTAEAVPFLSQVNNVMWRSDNKSIDMV